MDAEARLTTTVATAVNMASSRPARAGAWEWNLAAERWTLSRGLRQICGIGEGEETRRAWLRSLVHPEDQPDVQRTLAAAREGARPIDIHLRLLRGGAGAVRRLHVTGDFVCDDHGLATHAWGSAYDVTDTAGAGEDDADRQVAAALRASEERYRQMTDNAPMATAMADQATGRIVYANRRALKLFEIDEGEALGTAALGYYADPADRDALLNQVKSAGHVDGLVVRMRTARGRDLWVTVNARLTQYAGRPAIHGVYQDITEPIRMAEELRQSERRYRLLAENMQDVVWLMDLTSNEFTYVSPSVLRLRGYTAEEVMAMPAGEALTPASRQIITDEIEKALPAFLAGAPPGDPPALELEQPCKDGSTVWTEAIGKLFFNEETGHVEVYGLSRDLTERKAKEAEIRGLNNELEQRVVERTAQLEAALVELRQNEALKDAFLASISHELRTPLTGILALADALEMQTAGPLNERQQYFLARIRDSGDRLLKMITSILQYTALLAGKLQFRMEPCVLIELGALCLRDIRAAAAAKRVSMHMEVNPADLEITSDPDGIRQALNYLLDNAIKFTPAGGSAGLEMAADEAQGTVVLAVWDTGIGIDPAKTAAIFRPFEQVDGGLNRQYEGAGLGLACVYQLVKGLGGAIAVANTLGAGSRFSVTLPIGRGGVEK